MPASTNKANKTAGDASGKTSGAETKILELLIDMHEMGDETVPEDRVLMESGYSRTDSTGYRNIMKDLTKTKKYVVKERKTLRLTEEGIRFMESQQPNRPKKKRTNRGVEDFFKERILGTYKKVPSEKLDIVWSLLRDRRAHSAKEVLEATGYTRPDSTGYREIKKGLKNFGLLEQEGTAWKFVVEKVFPYPDGTEEDAE